NALAAGPAPVEIHLGVESDRLDGQPALRVTLRDNGPGIAPEQRQKVFEPFFTTKSKGTGLGLAIARRIVEAHAGRGGLTGDDRPGAVFVLTLPRGSPSP